MNGKDITKHWTVDWHVPLALILTIAAQTLALVAVGSWYLSELDNRVGIMEKTSVSYGFDIREIRSQLHDSDTMAARFDERLQSFDGQLNRFDFILNKIQYGERGNEE